MTEFERHWEHENQIEKLENKAQNGCLYVVFFLITVTLFLIGYFS